MMIFRRMRTLLFAPILALVALVFWSMSLQLPRGSVLDFECLVCRGIVVRDPSIWRMRMRAISLEGDLLRQRQGSGEEEIFISNAGGTGNEQELEETRSTRVEEGHEGHEDGKEIGELFQEIQNDSSSSSSSMDDHNSSLDGSTETGKKSLQRPNDPPSILRNASSPSNSSTEQADSNREGAIEEVERVMDFLRRPAQRKEVSWNSSSSQCHGRRVFVYDLPPKFNTDLLQQCATLIPWMSMCDSVRNSGMGIPVSVDNSTDPVLAPPGSWFKTHQYALEMIFHARILGYSCRTTDPSTADVFYIPYYAGLDVLRWNFVQGDVKAAQRDVLPGELMAWLTQQPTTWKAGDRRDHVIVLGKVSWDFRRMSSAQNWGNNLLTRGDMFNVTKLLIERQPWHPNDVGVPHPTFFHPRSDADIATWQARVLGDEVRPSLVAFAGQPRPGQAGSIRGELIRQCTARSDACRTLDCGSGACFGPEATIGLFLASDFCLQPVGDSPTRRSVFDSLLAGCIPVFFDPFTAYYQYPWHLPANSSTYSVMIPAESVTDGVDVVAELEKIPLSRRKEMRHFIVREILPGIVYSQPGSRLERFEDAFDIAMKITMARIASKEAYVSNTSR